MQRLLSGIAVGLFVATSAFVYAQKTVNLKTGDGGSPHVRSEWTIDGANISIEYGRPFLKGRPEAQMMPPGQEWRTGADVATIITSDKPLQFGAIKLAPGSYTINTVPVDNNGSWCSAASASPVSGAFRYRRDWRSAPARRWRSARRRHRSKKWTIQSTTRTRAQRSV